MEPLRIFELITSKVEGQAAQPTFQAKEEVIYYEIDNAYKSSFLGHFAKKLKVSSDVSTLTATFLTIAGIHARLSNVPPVIECGRYSYHRQRVTSSNADNVAAILGINLNAVPPLTAEILDLINVLMSGLCLLIAKNSGDTITQWMETRMKAMEDISNRTYNIHPFCFTYVINLAPTFVQVFEQSHLIRAIGLQYVLHFKGSTTLPGILCSYVADILEWTRVAYLKPIIYALIIADSPIIYLGSMQAELLRLSKALKFLRSSPHPMYVALVVPQDVLKANCLTRTAFPTLINVSIIAYGQDSFSRYAKAPNPNNRIVGLMTRWYSKTPDLTLGDNQMARIWTGESLRDQIASNRQANRRLAVNSNHGLGVMSNNASLFSQI